MNTIILDLTLPQNYVAEEILLGTILINPTVFPQLMPFLKPDAFFVESHRLIYKSLIMLHKSNKIDIIQLIYLLNDKEILYSIGGVPKIIELMRQSHMFMSSINIYAYVQELMNLVNNSYIKRLIIQYGYNVIQLASVTYLPSHHIYNKVSEYLESTVYKIPKENFMTFRDLIASLLMQVKYQNVDLAQLPVTQNTILSGFHKLDDLINGLQAGDLIVIAGRPSIGKTSFVINLVLNILNSIALGLCFFSLEMSKSQIVRKFVSVASGFPIHSICFSKLNSDQWYTLNKICRNLMNYNVYINDVPGISIDYIEYTAKLLHKETSKIQLIVIDYLQLIQIENFTNNTRTQELGYITRKLKLLAQYLDIPIIVLSQLNRSIETRVNKIPLLSDLRESGCLDVYNGLMLDLLNSLYIQHLYNSKILIRYNLLNAFRVRNFFTKFFHNGSLNIFFQYSFSVYCFISTLNVTHNHKVYMKTKWRRFNEYLQNSICIANYSHNLDFYYFFEYIYTNAIIYYDYIHVFDLQEPSYMVLLVDNFILHNSIEQDADIVIILSKDIQEVSSSNIIDVSLCKNRNGATGLCQLLFTPVNNTFHNIL
uniref:replication helicase subunit n=1 Tax=Gracilaria urvillei TaxID=172974 RepID=UPI001D109D9A|nr:replication helicase subunit [Hydropuntia urvillei]UAD88514.1 replication helicase subunit [Hydropuntia urvillei]